METIVPILRSAGVSSLEEEHVSPLVRVPMLPVGDSLWVILLNNEPTIGESSGVEAITHAVSVMGIG